MPIAQSGSCQWSTGDFTRQLLAHIVYAPPYSLTYVITFGTRVSPNRQYTWFTVLVLPYKQYMYISWSVRPPFCSYCPIHDSWHFPLLSLCSFDWISLSRLNLLVFRFQFWACLMQHWRSCAVLKWKSFWTRSFQELGTHIGKANVVSKPKKTIQYWVKYFLNWYIWGNKHNQHKLDFWSIFTPAINVPCHHLNQSIWTGWVRRNIETHSGRCCAMP